jgi:hypothetical protein
VRRQNRILGKDGRHALQDLFCRYFCGGALGIFPPVFLYRVKTVKIFQVPGTIHDLRNTSSLFGGRDGRGRRDCRRQAEATAEPRTARCSRRRLAAAPKKIRTPSEMTGKLQPAI